MRTILFDVDGVLIHGYHHKPEKQVRWDATLLADTGVDPDQFRQRFIFESFIKQVVVGRMPLATALDAVLPSLGYRGTSAAFIDYWLSHDSVVNVELLAVVRQLKQTGACRLFIATNQAHERADWLWGKLGFGQVFDDIFHSARAGAVKPTRPYFDWVADRLGRQSEPPLFFDDTPDVIKAARARGWEAVEYNDLSDVTGHPAIRALLGSSSIVTSR